MTGTGPTTIIDPIRRSNNPPDETAAISAIAPGPVAVSHVADFCRRYPGELVTFYTQVQLLASLPNLTLRVTIPDGFEVGDYQADAALGNLAPYVEIDKNGRNLVWLPESELPVGVKYEFQVEARVRPSQWPKNLESQAILSNTSLEVLAEASATVVIEPKGSYLHYLPELYERDELMGRFLMLFESFWSPIDTQIDSMANYFDPRMTPVAFLPWLASWLDLELDESWPEERVRQLVRWAIALHRSRGTRWGLLKYLELYTGQTAEIVERRAQNFVLGVEARLGPGIALGYGNVPHTFTVTLRLPAIAAPSEQERKRLEEVRRQTIEAIIQRQKPADTVYTLHLEPLAANKTTAEPAQPDRAVTDQPDQIAAQSAIWFKLAD